MLAVCNDCDFLPILPVLLDTERNYKALYRSWIDVLPRLNCSVVFVSEDPVSGEECFYYALTGWVFMIIDLSLRSLCVFCHAEAAYADKAEEIEHNLID